MKNSRTMGILIAVLWLACILALGARLPSLDPVKIRLEDMPINMPNVTKPELVHDQKEALKIMAVARQVPKDFEFLLKQYDQIPPFNPHRDPHLSADQIERYITAYYSYVNEMANFKKNTVGPRPGIFRVIAFYGMINNYYQVVRTRALVRVNMTGEEFEWIGARLMEAGLFAVLSALEDGQYDSEPQKKHLEGLRDALYVSVGVKEEKAGVVTYHPEKYQRWSVPRGNITLFLDYYRRPNQSGLNWPEIHFDRPTVITFNRETIMAKAAHNPP